jgi:GT2 family glycosyltransferase
MKRLSVEISTYNRMAILCRVLEGLARQTTPPELFEIVVADDGSSDGTAEMVESMSPSLPFDIRFVTHDHRGSGATHNLGIRNARGEIVLMLADDILPHPDLIQEHLKAHAQHPSPSVGVVGRLVQSPELPQTTFQTGWNVLVNALFPKDGITFDYRNFWVSHLSFKREFMLHHGMFREWPAASHEDLELGYRLQGRGMALHFNPAALGYHHHPETIESVTARAYAHGFNWHLFESAVPEVSVRVKSGNVRPTDGTLLYLRTRLKHRLRSLFVNRLTIPLLVVSLTSYSEKIKLPAFLMPFLVSKIASYHFHRGLNDYRAEQARRQTYHGSSGKEHAFRDP